MRQALAKFDASEPHFVDKGSLDDVFEMISYPYHPCMVYFPTFTIKINQL